jgi:beta-glucosidase
VVQLYTRQLVGSITRPVKELKDFERVFLNPGQTERVAFDLTADKLKFWNSQLEYAAEPGQFEVLVGPNSKETKQASFMLNDR